MKQLVFATLIFLSLGAFAQSISIPLPTVKKIVQKPASDLVSEDGRVLDIGEAAQRAQAGNDLSLLDPVPNKIWQRSSLSISDSAERNYPDSKIGVKFLSVESNVVLKGFVLSSIRVQSVSNPNLFFKLGISRYSQSMMMRSALLRRMGFVVPSPKYYRDLRLSFSSTEEKDKFLNEVQRDLNLNFESRKWLLENNTDNIVLASSTLEISSIDYFDLPWGLAPNPAIPEQRAIVDLFSKNRAYRALIIPYSLVDVPESINRYSSQIAFVQSGYAVINYFMAKSFEACSYDDAKWVLRKLSKLKFDDFKAIVHEAGYPKDIEALVLAKLLLRVKQLLTLFDLESVSPLPSLSLDITSSDGSIIKGKVKREFFDGYPQRFSTGDQPAPYNDGDFLRYFGIDLNSTLISNIADRLNEKLQVLGFDQAAEKFQERLYRQFMERLQNDPSSAFDRKVQSWGGPLLGLNINSSRHISTGTYSGSTAPIQLIDNISVGAGLGYFLTLDGLKYIPTLNTNLQFVRDYTHVRPILSIKEGQKEPWKKLLVPNFMQGLAKKIDSENVDAVISDLRDGEVFTISDSIVAGIGLQASSGLDALLGFAPFNHLNSVTLGADASRVMLKQTTITKTSEGLQIFVRQIAGDAKGAELNINYFLNLLKLRAQNSQSEIASDAFVIDYNPAAAQNATPESPVGKELAKTKAKLSLVLRSLFKSNDTENLYSEFKHKKFKLQHEFKTQSTQEKLLALRFGAFKEEHTLKLQYPVSEKHPELDPADQEVTLFAAKKGELHGRDLLGFFFDIIDGFLSKKNYKFSRSNSTNPANVPLGKAYWRTVTTDADLSVNVKQLPSVSILQHVWGGWSMKKAEFLKVVDQIEDEFLNEEQKKIGLIQKERFQEMQKIDFYRITANLSVLDSGLVKIQELLNQADISGEAPKAKFFLSRLFQKLSESNGKRDLKDKELFKEMLSFVGIENYNRECVNHGIGDSSEVIQPIEWLYGTEYECLTDWMRKLISLRRSFPATDKKAQSRWMTEVLWVLDQKIPLPQLLKYIEPQNYVFFVRVNGFRTGEEDGDLEYFSNAFGEPNQDFSTAGGLFQKYATKTRIIPVEIDRTEGGFQ